MFKFRPWAQAVWVQVLRRHNTEDYPWPLWAPIVSLGNRNDSSMRVPKAVEPSTLRLTVM